MSKLKKKTYQLYLFGFGSEDRPAFNLSLEKDNLKVELPTRKRLDRYIYNAYLYVAKSRRGNRIEMVELWIAALEQIRDSYDMIAKVIRIKHETILFREILHNLEVAKYYLRKRFSIEDLKFLME